LLPPEPYTFLAPLPFEQKVELRYRETIGLSTLLEGPFERAEIEALCSYVRRGSVAVDVGANIGIHTLVLAAAVGAEGRVLAFEPVPDNVERMQHNLRTSGLRNVDVFPLALGDSNGSVELNLSEDPAFHSTAAPTGASLDRSVTVATASLDTVLHQVHGPQVSAMKIDVEGDELPVLHGAREVIGASRPALLVEITSARQLAQVEGFLGLYDYRSEQRKGFTSWNYLFVAERANEQRGH
jgi:FkbM family methyltransferase